MAAFFVCPASCSFSTSMKKLCGLLFMLSLCATSLRAQVSLGVNLSPVIAGGELRDLNGFSIGGGFLANYRLNPRLGVGLDFNFNPFKGDSLQVSASVLQLQVSPSFYQEINSRSEVYISAAAGVFFGRYVGVHTILENHVLVGVTPRLGYAIDIGPESQFFAEFVYAFTPFPDEDFAARANYLVGDYRFYGLHLGITYSLEDL